MSIDPITAGGGLPTPIEATLAGAVELMLRRRAADVDLADLAAVHAAGEHPNTAIAVGGHWCLFFDAPIGPYWADMLLVSARGLVVVEADGHDYHEKTKAQAAHDRRRDRYMTLHGYRVLRFTGSEIHRDSAACAKEVEQHLDSMESKR